MTTLANNRNNINQQPKIMAGQKQSARTGRKFGTVISNQVSATSNDATAAKSMHNQPVVEKRVTRSMARANPSVLKPKPVAARTAVANRIATVTPMESETVTTTDTSVATDIVTAHIANLQINVPAPQDATSTKIAAPSLSYQDTGPVDDIDEEDMDDPLKVAAYVEDIFAMHRAREGNVKPTYMKNQPQINERMRAILIDWCVSVQIEHDLCHNTIYLTVILIDQVLEKKLLRRDNLQLVGIACLFLASKYEDVYFPEMKDLVAVCDNTYTAREIANMEIFILRTLEYRITVSTSHDFLERYQKAGHLGDVATDLASYLLESTLIHYDLLEYKPSQLASAAVMIARKMEGKHLWSPTLLKYAEYREEEIVPVARAILQAKTTEISGHLLGLQRIRKKYGRSKFHRVSNATLPAPSDL